MSSRTMWLLWKPDGVGSAILPGVIVRTEADVYRAWVDVAHYAAWGASRDHASLDAAMADVEERLTMGGAFS